jgi:hypothetical protein
MSWLFAFALAGSPPTPVQLLMQNEVEVTRRFIAAVRNKQPYQDSDFVKPLSERDKAFFARYSRCSTENVGHGAVMHPTRPNTFVRVPGSVSLQWRCGRLPPNSPTYFSVNFKDGKIHTIETHRR